MITARELIHRRNALTAEYYEEVKNARKNGIPVAYITGFMPQEILYAMGIMPVLPENYAPLICAQGFSDEFCRLVEEKGYSPELCGIQRPGLVHVQRRWALWRLPKTGCGHIVRKHVRITSPLVGDHKPILSGPHFLLDAPHTNASQRSGI